MRGAGPGLPTSPHPSCPPPLGELRRKAGKARLRGTTTNKTGGTAAAAGARVLDRVRGLGCRSSSGGREGGQPPTSASVPEDNGLLSQAEFPGKQGASPPNSTTATQTGEGAHEGAACFLTPEANEASTKAEY